MIAALIASLISVAALCGAYFLIIAKQSSVSKASLEEEIAKINAEDARLFELVGKAKDLISSKQIESVKQQLLTAVSNLEKERETLKQIESSLTTAQQSVEERESRHQELKTSKDDEEEKLGTLMETHERLSGEAIELESQLNICLQNLEKLLSESELDINQKAALTDLNKSIEDASARLRDLIFEYNAVKERLDSLMAQHRDLEEEYTRLVEQQLG